MNQSVRTKVFKTHRSQAVRLPKAVAFPEGVSEVEIKAIGDIRIISPVVKDWAEWFRTGPSIPDGFDTGTDPPPEEREPL
jgi:antitoxin VapB